MTRILIFCCLVIVPFLFLSVFPQNPGDHYATGYTANRTYFSRDSKLTAPLRRTKFITLNQGQSPDLLLAFEDSFLVRVRNSDQTRYRLLEKTGQLRWERPGAPLCPAYSHGVVILGSAATTSFAAVTVTSGSVLWETGSLGLDLGEITGRSPVITGELAVVYGAKKAAAVRVSDGQLIWEYAPSGVDSVLDRTPLSLSGDRVYLADQAGSIYCLDLLTGAEVWAAQTTDTAIASIVATEGTVFVAGKSEVQALSAKEGKVVWKRGMFRERGFRRLALGLGLLYVFEDESAECGGLIHVTAFEPTAGALRWGNNFFWGWPLCYTGASELIPVLGDTLISNGLIFVGLLSGALEPSEGIAILDASDGTLKWFVSESSKTFSTSYGCLFALRRDSIDVLEPSPETFLPELASGQGYSTLITLTNPSMSRPAATIFFIGGDGRPLELPVENVGTVSEVHLNFSFQESKAIRVMNRPGPIATGWARVVSDVPLTGTSSYQFSPDGEVLREVGVGHCEPSASYTLYVQRQGRFDTALGIANPSDSRAVVHTALRDSLGAPAGAFAIPLGPGEHIAMFFHELVYQIPAGNFEGTLRIFADRPLVVTAIRTMDGIPMSGYPTAGRIR